MPGAVSPLLLSLVLLGFEDRAEARARSFSDEEVFVDLVEAARLTLSVSEQRNVAELNYSPSLTLFSVGTSQMDLATFHTLSGMVAHTYRRGYVSLHESLTIGRENFRLALTPSAFELPDPTDPTLTPKAPGAAAAQASVFDRLVWFGSTTTTLSLGQMLTPRTNLFEYASYGVHGGLDPGARELYPFFRQLSVGGGVTHSLSLRDTLLSGVDAQRTSTSDDVEVDILILREAWTHVVSPTTTTSLMAGASYASQRSPTGDIRLWLPVAEAGVVTTWASYPRRSLSATVGVAPVADWLSGLLDYRAYGSLALTETRGRLSWSVATSATSSIGSTGDSDLTAIVVSGLVSYQKTPELFFDASAGTSWLLFDEQVGAPPALWNVSAGVTYRPRAWRL